MERLISDIKDYFSKKLGVCLHNFFANNDEIVWWKFVEVYYLNCIRKNVEIKLFIVFIHSNCKNDKWIIFAHYSETANLAVFWLRCRISLSSFHGMILIILNGSTISLIHISGHKYLPKNRLVCFILYFD